MAVLRFPDTYQTITAEAEIRAALASQGNGGSLRDFAGGAGPVSKAPS